MCHWWSRLFSGRADDDHAEIVGQGSSLADGELRDGLAPAPGYLVSLLPLLDRVASELLVAKLREAFGYDRGSAQGVDEISMLHDADIIRRFVGSVNDPLSDDPTKAFRQNVGMPAKPRDPYAVAVGQRLRWVRVALGYDTVKRFAQITDVEMDRLSSWERGVNMVQPEYVELLRQTFRIPHDYVYGGERGGLPGDLGIKILAMMKAEQEKKAKPRPG